MSPERERRLMKKKLEYVKDGVLNLLFPARCPVCDKPAPFPARICPVCRKKAVAVNEPVCLKCGKHMADETEEYCKGCRTMTHMFERGRGLFFYRPMAVSFYRFKYAGRREYACFYADEIVKELGGTIRAWKPDVLVPVPVHYTRKRKRGYNQAEVLAEEIGKRMGLPVARNLLTRVKKTVPQKLLDDAGRQNNLKKAFKIEKNDVELKRVILIDDIYTTGSTIDACAAEMKRAGVGKVYFITAAIGRELS